MQNNPSSLAFEDCNYLRQKLILATLSGRAVTISNIRRLDDDPGLKEYEVNVLALIDTMTNGSRIEINETGTKLRYQPGLLHGGKFEHECNVHRSISYYLEVILCLAPFCKKSVEATLKGVTNNQMDPSVDSIKYGSLPMMQHFLGVDEGLELNIVARAIAPGGGGEVFFKCPTVRQLLPVQLTYPGKIKKIRGVAFTVEVSSAIATSMIEAAKDVLTKFIPDVKIFADKSVGVESGRSPGFGLTLVAETTNGSFLSVDVCSRPSGLEGEPSVPEKLGRQGARLLIQEIYRGGYVGSVDQSATCLFMALGQMDVSNVVMGPLSPYTIQFLRDLREFFHITFEVTTLEHDYNDLLFDTSAPKVLMSCVGVAFVNLNKSTF